MPLEQSIQATNPKKKNSTPAYIIVITTINEGDDGKPEIYKIVTTVDDHEKLYKEFKKVVE